ncbi:MAG: hypothetical protein H7X88_08795, partial [Gloeobacteraceae cyanobacterium ES-bin-316]|nr:hypothetical protein [Ferruginibacter sp.]
MNTKSQLLLAAMIFIMVTKSNAQANQSLSNLTAPTAVNQDLLPDLSNTRNLGGTGIAWKRLFINDRLYMKGKIVIQIPGTNNFFIGTSAGNSAVTGSSNTA